MSIPGFHIPGTLVPIGAVMAQQQDQDDEEALLLLLTGDQPADLLGGPGGSVVGEYAVLEFNRVTRAAHSIYTLTWADQTVGPVKAAEKDAKLHEVAQLNRSRQQAVEEEREQWRSEHTEVREKLSEEVSTGTFRKEIRYFDEVVVDGEVTRTATGQGEAKARRLAERQFPAAKELKVDITEERFAEEQTWEASWTTGERYESVPAPEKVWWNSIPTSWVVAELNARAREGWQLLHVSVDEGLFKGRVARLAAGPETVRYLFGR